MKPLLVRIRAARRTAGSSGTPWCLFVSRPGDRRRTRYAIIGAHWDGDPGDRPRLDLAQLRHDLRFLAEIVDSDHQYGARL